MVLEATEEVRCEDMEWIQPAQDRVQQRDLVYTVMNIRVP
jgi:hypothetical protein